MRVNSGIHRPYFGCHNHTMEYAKFGGKIIMDRLSSLLRTDCPVKHTFERTDCPP